MLGRTNATFVEKALRGNEKSLDWSRDVTVRSFTKVCNVTSGILPLLNYRVLAVQYIYLPYMLHGLKKTNAVALIPCYDLEGVGALSIMKAHE